MWEIDELIKVSRDFVINLNIDNDLKSNLVWSVEQLPNEYKFDAGGYEHFEIREAKTYQKYSPFEIGNLIIKEAKVSNSLIYDWVAFLLNFWEEYFPEDFTFLTLKEKYFIEIKEKYRQCNFKSYEPIHRTLTIYPQSNGWFSQEQNKLIDWFNE